MKTPILIGSHVSNSGKLMLLGSINEALSYGANSLMVYLGAPQNSIRKPLEELRINEMHEVMTKHNIPNENIIVHAPYIVNLATPNEEKRQFAVEMITKELNGVDKLKARCLVVHPGSSMDLSREEGIKNIADSLIKVLNNTANQNTVIALETMAGKGSELACNFHEIKQIIDLVSSPRIQVCLDTCHVFDSGYDIVNCYDDVINEFDNVIGLNKLAVIHLNDSKNVLGSHKDRHENIGFGNIGFETLSKFVHDDRFSSIPKILETPYVDKLYPPYKDEIEMLLNNVFDEKLYDKIKSR